MLWQSASPSPVPWPGGFVVKNGSKIGHLECDPLALVPRRDGEPAIFGGAVPGSILAAYRQQIEELVREAREELAHCSELLALVEHLGLGLMLRRAQPPLLEGLTDRRPEARQPILEQAIDRALLHQRHGSFLADRAGHDDERNAQLALPQDLESARGAEGRRAQEIHILGFGHHATPVGGEPRTPQFGDHQLGVRHGLFDDQHVDRCGRQHVFLPGPYAVGGWLHGSILGSGRDACLSATRHRQ